MKPTVSIITPTYNQEDFIEKCIQSVLNQTFTDWEMLVIDDKSRDRTPQIGRKYSKREGRIRFFQTNHNGIWNLSETYNKGLEKAKGKFIAILEGDDFWPPYKLKEEINAFDDESVGLAYGRVMNVDRFGEGIRTQTENFAGNIFRNRPLGKILEKLLIKNFIPAVTVVCRKDFLEKIGGFKQPQDIPTVDYPTWLELSLICRFRPVDRILGYWRRYKSQVTQTFDSVHTRLRISKFCLNFFDRLAPELKDKLNIGRADLVEEYRRKIGKSYFKRGRKRAVNQKWKLARDDFLNAIREGSFYRKSVAFLSFLLSLVEMDIESIAKVSGGRRFGE